MNSGAVKEGPGKVRISPIEGPGVCGADFPLKVSSLGDSGPLGYDDDPRPPGAVPTAPGQVPPRWPIVQPRPAAAAVTRDDLPGPDGSGLLSDQPLSLDPGARAGAAPEPYDFRKPYRAAPSPAARPAAASVPAASDPGSPYDFSPEPYDRRQVIGAARPAPRPAPAPPPTLGPASAPPVARRERAGRGQPGGDARLPAGLGARPVDHRGGAAGSPEMVRRAGGRDQADFRLFLPRHERRSQCNDLGACVRQCARHRGFHAGRRPQIRRGARLARLAGGAGLPARRAGHRLRSIHHRAGAGLQSLPLQSHSRRPDAPAQWPAGLPAGAGQRGRSGGAAGISPRRRAQRPRR